MKINVSNEIEDDLTQYMKHKGNTPEEQLQKNQAAMALLKSWIEEEISEEESKERAIYFETFKKIIDDGRMPGYKFYSEE